jgi:hypothetical protein
MYLVDEFGKRYNFRAAGRDAIGNVVMPEEGDPVYGWFAFPIPTNGAKYITFHDDDQHISIDLGLTNREVVEGEAELTKYPVQITYVLKAWKVGQDELGNLTFTAEGSPGCTLSEAVEVSPDAKYKTTVNRGGITYEVYGWYDAAQKQNARDYVATAGLEAAQTRPIFDVTLPTGEEIGCLSRLDMLLGAVEASAQGASMTAPAATGAGAATPDPKVLLPGLYHTQGCAKTGWWYGGNLSICVEYAEIKDDLLNIVVSWTVTDTGLPASRVMTKRSDAHHSIYMIDEYGEHYNLLATGGASAQDTVIVEGVPLFGWYSFEVPRNGARRITLYDDFHHVHFNLELTAREVVEATATLTKYRLQLTYRIRNWEIGEGKGGVLTLSDTRIERCTFTEVGEVAPQAKLKNAVSIGSITYGIYGWFDSATQLQIRDYVATDGLGVQELDPIFEVTIPPLEDVECLTHLDELLLGVEPLEE